MEIAMVGLGKMGANMAKRLLLGEHRSSLWPYKCDLSAARMRIIQLNC